jgi:mono/diheme cytochrome c family protein
MSAAGSKLLLGLALGLGLTGCQPANETDEWSQNEVFQRMQRQPKYRVYQRNDFFADKRAMRHPPVGTVSREWFGAHRVPGGLRDGAFVDQGPLRVTEALLAVGKKHFDIVCATCHGLAGDGQSLVAVNMALTPPPSFHAEKLRNQPDGHFYEVITHGYGVMPPFGWRMTPTERWAVVAYVRALQYSQAVPLADAPAEVRTRLLREGQ